MLLPSHSENLFLFVSRDDHIDPFDASWTLTFYRHELVDSISLVSFEHT
jgi:hypothetical protein